MTESLTVPGAWFMEDATVDSYLVIITNVDDILYKETGGRNRILTERLISHFKKCYGADDVTVKYKPLMWNGYALAWSADGSIVTLSMEQHVVQLARDYVPELLDVDAPMPIDILSGIKLQAAADGLCKPDVTPKKMCAAGKETQQIAGATSYIIAGVHLRFSLIQHRIACVASMAKQPEAHTVARSLIAALYQRRKEGITYGGQLTERVLLQGGLYANLDLEATAPEEAEIHADANVDGRSVYAMILTHNGGAVAHAVKKISTVVEIIDELGSVGNESVATERAAQLGVYATEILRVYGHPPTSPIIIGTDNSANLTLGLGTATPGKAKHALRRWAHIRAQVRQGTVKLVKIDTNSMPVDFMTKWKGKKQTDIAVAYITNSKNQITSNAETSALEKQDVLRLRGGHPASEKGPSDLMIADLNAVLAHQGLQQIAIPKHEMIPRSTRFVFEHGGLPHDHKPTFAEVWERYTLTEDDLPHVPEGTFAGTELLPLAQTDRLDPLYQVYTANPPAPDELQFNHAAFVRGAAELAQSIAESGMQGTFGIFADNKVRLYIGPPPRLDVDDDAAREFERAHVLQDNWTGHEDLSLNELMGTLVHEAIVSIELKEARRTAGLVTEYTTTTHRKVKKRKRDRVYPPLTVREIKEATLAELDRPLYMPNPDDPDEPPTLEVSAAETRDSFMTLRSTRLKYATRPPAGEAPSATWYAGDHAAFPPTEAPIEEMFDDAPPWRSEWYGTLDLKGRPIEYYGHRRPGQNSDAESYDYD
jgi:hypothetical protein